MNGTVIHEVDDAAMYSEWLNRFDWSRGFGPQDFLGKHVLAVLDDGTAVRGALTCAGPADGDSGRIFLKTGGASALCGDHAVRRAVGLAVLERRRPTERTDRTWVCAGGVLGIALIWDEREYEFIFPEMAEPGCMAVIGTRLYPVTRVRDSTVTIDAGKRLVIPKGMAAEFVRPFRRRPQAVPRRWMGTEG